MDCGLDNTIKCMCVVDSGGEDHGVELGWGAVRRRKEEEPQKEPGVSNVGIWLDSDVINRYIKNKRQKSRLGEEANECSFGYVGLR